ncbi:GlcG/HbpS family heme-binding protein [Marinomonas gallaica]|uniref:GlcG/HbpS family heme-binding protein n=1 Tax=Marinomonas gallaica TaxID=1806667 RepID=UPI003A8E1BF5
MIETTISQHNLTTAAAAQIGATAMAHATSLGIHISICIVDASGIPLVSLRMNQSPLLSIGIAEKKAYTAVSFGKPTQSWQSTLMNKEKILFALQNEPNFTYLGGGLPIHLETITVGAIGVSGGSETQDIDCAQVAIDALINNH